MKRKRNERGQSILLFAILMPLMSLFLLGILDYMVTNARVMEAIAVADLAAMRNAAVRLGQERSRGGPQRDRIGDHCAAQQRDLAHQPEGQTHAVGVTGQALPPQTRPHRLLRPTVGQDARKRRRLREFAH